MAGIHCAALRRNNVDRTVEAFIQRNVRIDEAFQDVDTGGECLGQVAIHGSGALRVGARKIERYIFAVQSDASAEMNWFGGDAVIIQLIFGFESSTGQL